MTLFGRGPESVEEVAAVVVKDMGSAVWCRKETQPEELTPTRHGFLF